MSVTVTGRISEPKTSPSRFAIASTEIPYKKKRLEPQEEPQPQSTTSATKPDEPGARPGEEPALAAAQQKQEQQPTLAGKPKDKAPPQPPTGTKHAPQPRQTEPAPKLTLPRAPTPQTPGSETPTTQLRQPGTGRQTKPDQKPAAPAQRASNRERIAGNPKPQHRQPEPQKAQTPHPNPDGENARSERKQNQDQRSGSRKRNRHEKRPQGTQRVLSQQALQKGHGTWAAIALNSPLLRYKFRP